eukprot:s9807_g1.t1
MLYRRLCDVLFDQALLRDSASVTQAVCDTSQGLHLDSPSIASVLDHVAEEIGVLCADAELCSWSPEQQRVIFAAFDRLRPDPSFPEATAVPFLGWSSVVFDNHQIDLSGTVAIAMGNYYFTSAADGSKTKVEYTFGYKKNSDGKVRIFLHHSSVPFSPDPASAVSKGGAGAVSEEEVRAAQAAWANAIKTISRTYLDGGDYVAVAGKAAGELYGYGHTKVLFKPTKAKDVQFRPMASQAMSYFVGCKAVEDGIPEDGGFAINGGKG